MVFVSLEGVVGASSAARGSFAAQPAASAASPAPIRVVVTPGSAAKCTSGGGTGVPAAFSSRRLRRFWRSDSASHFVCFVTDGVMRHKWVVVKRAAECAALRKLLLRAAGDCKSDGGKKSGAPCSCRAVRALAKPSSSKNSKDLGSQYGQARALEELLNALLSAMLTSQADSVCAAAASALAVVEAFLDVEERRADAVDRLVRMASSSMEDDTDAARFESEEESPEQPSGQDCECSICCGELASGETLRLPCDHEFHADCVQLWLRMQQTCPVCRVAARVAA